MPNFFKQTTFFIVISRSSIKILGDEVIEIAVAKSGAPNLQQAIDQALQNTSSRCKNKNVVIILEENLFYQLTILPTDHNLSLADLQGSETQFRKTLHPIAQESIPEEITDQDWSYQILSAKNILQEKVGEDSRILLYSPVRREFQAIAHALTKLECKLITVAPACVTRNFQSLDDWLADWKQRSQPKHEIFEQQFEDGRRDTSSTPITKQLSQQNQSYRPFAMRPYFIIALMVAILFGASAIISMLYVQGWISLPILILDIFADIVFN